MNKALLLRGYALGVGLMASASIFAANNSFFDQGLVYYSQGQYRQALEQFHRAADAGEAGADYMLMKMHSEGRVASQDAQNAVEAFQWAQKAAASGIAQAQYRLAQMYASGTGTVADQQQAFHWYREAARQYHPLAMQQLAHHYEAGLGVAKNKDQARHWYSIAASELDVFAQKGDSASQNRLAGLYEQGKGVKTNLAMAETWYRKAALQGFADAQFNLGRLLALGDIERNLEEAVYWLQRAVEAGHSEAGILLAKVTKAAQSEEVAYFNQ